MEYIIHFAKAVQLYQQKNRSSFGCGSPNHLMWDCSKDLSKSARKDGFKHQKRDGKERRLGPSEASCCSVSIPRRDPLNINTSWKTPFLNPDHLTEWRAHWGSILGCWSIEQPGHWHNGYKWFWRIILLTLGLHYHKGSGGRGERLWWRSNGPSCTRFNYLWIMHASYPGHINHQSNHKCDQREWNRWVVSFLEWVENVPLVGISLSRTFY